MTTSCILLMHSTRCMLMRITRVLFLRITRVLFLRSTRVLLKCRNKWKYKKKPHYRRIPDIKYFFVTIVIRKWSYYEFVRIKQHKRTRRYTKKRPWRVRFIKWKYRFYKTRLYEYIEMVATISLFVLILFLLYKLFLLVICLWYFKIEFHIESCGFLLFISKLFIKARLRAFIKIWANTVLFFIFLFIFTWRIFKPVFVVYDDMLEFYKYDAILIVRLSFIVLEFFTFLSVILIFTSTNFIELLGVCSILVSTFLFVLSLHILYQKIKSMEHCPKTLVERCCFFLEFLTSITLIIVIVEPPYNLLVGVCSIISVSFFIIYFMPTNKQKIWFVFIIFLVLVSYYI